MPQKLYCYVDETGQDTGGKLFVVGIVAVESERDSSRQLCEQAEQASGKQGIKWANARFSFRRDYIGRVLHEPAFKGRLFFACYEDSKDYLGLTIRTIARTLEMAGEPKAATVLIDALPHKLERQVSLQLRRFGYPVDKVRGVAKDENESLIRLADSLCGLVRDALEGQEDLQELWDWSIRTRVLIEL